MSVLPVYRPVLIGNDLNLFSFLFLSLLDLEVMKSPLHTQILSGCENRFWNQFLSLRLGSPTC